MTLYCLADSTDVRLFVPSHRTSSLTLQLQVLFALPFEPFPATLLDDVQGLFGQKTLGRRSSCISQTALRHLEDFGLEVCPDFHRIVGIDIVSETFRRFPFVFLGNALVLERADL